MTKFILKAVLWILPCITGGLSFVINNVYLKWTLYVVDAIVFFILLDVYKEL